MYQDGHSKANTRDTREKITHCLEESQLFVDNTLTQPLLCFFSHVPLPMIQLALSMFVSPLPTCVMHS